MILEVDCGNTLIKWRLIDGSGCQLKGGGVPDYLYLLRSIADFPKGSIRGCRMVSVRGEEETSALQESLSRLLDIPVRRAVSSPQAGGVVNGYLYPEKLGEDRWLALLGARQITREACLVIDVGTAITADHLASNGQHLGGYICPGLPLLRGQLQKHTARIRYDLSEAVEVVNKDEPGKETVTAVERGCLSMLRGFVFDQIRLARDSLGKSFCVLLTGGDVALVGELPVRSRVVPDLIFIGLAVACPDLR